MLAWLQWALSEVITIQRHIYLAFGDRISTYGETGDWSALAIFLPLGIVFGAVHAMTPGHSKTVLVAYTAASQIGVLRALRTAFILSSVHVLMSVVIVVLSLPLVSTVLGSAGYSPILHGLSRGLLGLIGLWIILSALRTGRYHAPRGHGDGFAVIAGLIPCPLTLFVMTFAVTRGVVEAGVAFSVVMLAGVFLTLGTVAGLAAVLQNALGHRLTRAGEGALRSVQFLQIMIGIVFIVIALNALIG